MQTEKIDSREVYNEVEVDCDCNADKACNECIDGGLYDGPEIQPPFSYDTSIWTEEDERAMHTLVHCEDEQSCRFCNPPAKPVDLQVDGPKSCEKYYESCRCNACHTRDVWYATEAT